MEAIRPAMWEEHCLECSAPLCFESCLHYQARSDGRCKRFENGLQTFADERACCGQGVRVKFRKWGNMMTVLFPAMMTEAEYMKLHNQNLLLGKGLGLLEGSPLPRGIRWQGIRTIEYLRRRKLRSLQGMDNRADAFVFHGYSYMDQPYRLIVEVFDDHTSVFRLALALNPGENLFVLPNLSPECSKSGNLVKIYPENDLEAELDILWCDFVKGKPIEKKAPDAKVKCVVWDLDGTLWNGILIETDDVQTLQIRPEVLDTIRKLDERGIIQSVASKNDHQAAWPILEKLGVAEYFLYPQIHWNAKSESLKAIAADLNIGVDALALIDDSVFEREQVKAALPQVRTYDAADVRAILELPEFNVPVTQESRQRRAMYQAEEKRSILRKAQKTDIAEFIRSCHLRLEVFEPKTAEEILRCYELIVRTNQLNMSGRKYSREEFDQILSGGNRKSFAMRCEDNFGSYGIVGFGQYHIEGKQLVFDEFAMSCRVAGKYVESALFAYLLEKEQCSEGRFAVVKTKKNALLRNTLDQIGFCVTEEEETFVNYRFDTELIFRDIVELR